MMNYQELFMRRKIFNYIIKIEIDIRLTEFMENILN